MKIMLGMNVVNIDNLLLLEASQRMSSMAKGCWRFLELTYQVIKLKGEKKMGALFLRVIGTRLPSEKVWSRQMFVPGWCPHTLAWTTWFFHCLKEDDYTPVPTRTPLIWRHSLTQSRFVGGIAVSNSDSQSKATNRTLCTLNEKTLLKCLFEMHTSLLHATVLNLLTCCVICPLITITFAKRFFFIFILFLFSAGQTVL